MSRIAILVASVCISASGCHISQQQESKSQGILSPGNRVALGPTEAPFIVGIDTLNSSAGCTGTFIGPSHVLTARHCRALGLRFKLGSDVLTPWIDPDRHSRDGWDGILVPVSERFDYAIAQVHWFGPPKAVIFAHVAAVGPSLGDKIEIVGYPIDLDGRLHRSSCQVKTVDAAPYESGAISFFTQFGYNCSQTKQNSGGPVLDEVSRKVVGVVYHSSADTNIPADTDSSAALSYATSIAAIRYDNEVLKLIENNAEQEQIECAFRILFPCPQGSSHQLGQSDQHIKRADLVRSKPKKTTQISTVAIYMSRTISLITIKFF